MGSHGSRTDEEYGGTKMKTITKKKAKDKAWKAFSEWVRRSSADQFGFVKCYTCYTRTEWKFSDAGHWVEGHSNAVYINPEYVRVQCQSCNRFHGGRQGEFRDRLRKELGDEKVDQLLIDSKKTLKLSIFDYENLEQYYKEKLKAL